MKFLLLSSFVVMATLGRARGDETRCPQPWVFFQDNCYRYFGDRVTWEEARKRCGDHYSVYGRGDLVSIHGQHENAYAYDLFRSAAGGTPQNYEGGPPYYGAWIGGTSVGSLAWSDNSYAKNFDSWLPGQPDNHENSERCVAFWRRNNADDELKSWNDASCELELPYICKIAPNYYNHQGMC